MTCFTCIVAKAKSLALFSFYSQINGILFNAMRESEGNEERHLNKNAISNEFNEFRDEKFKTFSQELENDYARNVFSWSLYKTSSV